VKTIESRYDGSATAYRTWWEPVLAPTARELLDRLERAAGPPIGRVLDVGTGAGLLAIEAVRRWTMVEVTGLDGSAPMLVVAEAAGLFSFERATTDQLAARPRRAAAVRGRVD
jgi:trans-aconitate methyltransferase